MHTRLPYWDGKKWRFGKLKKLKARKKSRKTKKPKKLTEAQQGEEFGKALIKLWDLLTNRSKFYVNEYRLHHGLEGAGVYTYGAYKNNKFLKGVGKALMKDDINDLPDWLNFKDETKEKL